MEEKQEQEICGANTASELPIAGPRRSGGHFLGLRQKRCVVMDVSAQRLKGVDGNPERYKMKEPAEGASQRANDFFKANYAKFPLGFQQQPVVFEFAEAYAAAVSKNLQQSVEQLCGDLKAIQQDYTNEKKRAENFQEELMRSQKRATREYRRRLKIERAINRDSRPILHSLKSAEARILELEKEIAGLRTAQSAATGTESHWRGRDAALRETKP